ncbi:DUF4148 domain-containing protein [Noviherbaspirillum aerium]|uniref:DUF4148 domain-containing protein n=1 Tax=Noviherbaspirillum aerium TaxID=2588497 RepID=UPI00124EEC2F|nr:DUF4148 domain-containing protein [Noviherbaspirillum aerium]
MRNKMLIAATLFAVTGSGAFAQDLLLANAGYAGLEETLEAGAGNSAAMAMAPSATIPETSQGKTRQEVREELAEYNRQNPRGYLYTYYLGHVIGQVSIRQ